MDIVSGKLFLIAYAFGHVGMTVPIPGDSMEMCEQFARDMVAQCDPVKAEQNGFKCSDVKFVCEFHDERPPLDPSPFEDKTQ